MRREDAIKKLTKLLGKRLAYRVDPKAPEQDDRERALERLSEIRPERDALKEQMRLRVKALLDNDPEYQRLKSEHEVLNKECEKTSGMQHWYRFTAGVITSYGFFSIKAQGDNWEEVIAKLQKEKVGT